MSPQLDKYIPLLEAAKKYGVSTEALTRLVESGRVRAVRLADSERGIAVAQEDTAIAAAIHQTETEGDELVSVSEAARRLGLNSGIVWWWYKRGWLPEQDEAPTASYS